MSLGNVIQELVVRIRYVVDNGGLEKANTSVRSLRRSIAALGIGAGLYKVGHTAFQTAAMLESAQAQFETMLGSKVAADKMMNDMWEYAATSTFEMSDVTKAGTTLLNYGMTQEQVTDSMKRLGDIAGDSAPAFQRLALAYAQSFGKMRLTGEELRQFINAKANPLKAIADKHFGGNYAEAEEAMRKRKISFAMVEEALRSLTDEGGKFYQNQIKQSKTLTGAYTTMIDRLKASAAKVVMVFSDQIKSLMIAIGTLDLSFLLEVAGAIKHAFQIVGAVIRHFLASISSGMLANALATFRRTFNALINSEAFKQYWVSQAEWLSLILGLLATLATLALYGAVVFMKLWMAFWNGVIAIRSFFGLLIHMAGRIPEIFAPVGQALMDFFSLIGRALQPVVDVVDAIWYWLDVAWTKVVDFFGWLWDMLQKFDKWTKDHDPLKGLSDRLDAFILKFANGVGGIFMSVFGWVGTKVSEMSTYLVGLLGRVGAWIDEKTGLVTGGKKVISTSTAAITQFVGEFKKGLATVGTQAVVGLGDTTLADVMNKQTTGALGEVKKQVSGDGKTTNINQKVDFKVNVEGDKNAKSGLTAADVALLAERASRATFSLELERVLGAAL